MEKPGLCGLDMTRKCMDLEVPDRDFCAGYLGVPDRHLPWNDYCAFEALATFNCTSMTAQKTESYEVLGAVRRAPRRGAGELCARFRVIVSIMTYPSGAGADLCSFPITTVSFPR